MCLPICLLLIPEHFNEKECIEANNSTHIHIRDHYRYLFNILAEKSITKLLIKLTIFKKYDKKFKYLLILFDK